jgi:hypothetical protein
MNDELKASIKAQQEMSSTLVDDLESNGLTEELDLTSLLDTLASNGLVLAPISGEHNVASLAYFDSIGIDVEELIARG